MSHIMGHTGGIDVLVRAKTAVVLGDCVHWATTFDTFAGTFPMVGGDHGAQPGVSLEIEKAPVDVDLTVIGVATSSIAAGTTGLIRVWGPAFVAVEAGTYNSRDGFNMGGTTPGAVEGSTPGTDRTFARLIKETGVASLVGDLLLMQVDFLSSGLTSNPLNAVA